MEEYMKQHMLTQVRLYLLTRKATIKDTISKLLEHDSDDDDLDDFNIHSKPHSSPITVSDDDFASFLRSINLPTPFGSSSRSKISQLLGSNNERQQMREERKKDYDLSFKMDREKARKRKEKEVEDIRLKALMETRKSRLPPEPLLSDDHVTVSVRHVMFQGQTISFIREDDCCV